MTLAPNRPISFSTFFRLIMNDDISSKEEARLARSMAKLSEKKKRSTFTSINEKKGMCFSLLNAMIWR